MNDIFNIRRFGAFALKCYKEIGFIRLCIIWTISFLLMCVCLYDFVQESGKENYFRCYDDLIYNIQIYTNEYADLYRQGLVLLVFFTALVSSWKLFGNVKLKNTWLLPVSKFEKLCFIALNSLVINVVLFTVLSYGAISLVSNYKHVGLQELASHNEYSRLDFLDEMVEAFGENIIVEGRKAYRKVYFKPSFPNFFNASGPVISTKETADYIKPNHAYNYNKSTYGWLVLLFAFPMALWIGVSSYKKSWIMAFALHICLFWLPAFVYVTIYIFRLVSNVMSNPGLDFYSDTPYGIFDLYVASKIYLLFPIAYLLIACRKIKTMQIKQGRGIMKKYDLFILAIYVTSIILIVRGVNTESYKKTDASLYFIKLEKQAIKVVVIENTGVNLKVLKKENFDHYSYGADNQTKIGLYSQDRSDKMLDASNLEFKLIGDISLSSVSAFRIEQDTLFIDKANIGSKKLELHLRKHIQVDTLNAPNVTIVNK